MYVPVEVDRFSGSVPEEEHWKDVDEVRRGSMCCNGWMMGHFARDGRRKGKETEARDAPKGGENNKLQREREVQANWEDPVEDSREKRKAGDNTVTPAIAYRSEGGPFRFCSFPFFHFFLMFYPSQKNVLFFSFSFLLLLTPPPRALPKTLPFPTKS